MIQCYINKASIIWEFTDYVRMMTRFKKFNGQNSPPNTIRYSFKKCISSRWMQNHGLEIPKIPHNLFSRSAWDLIWDVIEKIPYWTSVVRENSFSLDVSKDLLLRRFNGQSCQMPNTYLKPRFEMYKGIPINHIP